MIHVLVIPFSAKYEGLEPSPPLMLTPGWLIVRGSKTLANPPSPFLVAPPSPNVAQGMFNPAEKESHMIPVTIANSLLIQLHAIDWAHSLSWSLLKPAG